MKKDPMEQTHHKDHHAEFVVKHSRTWDRMGMLTSGLCLIHCLATPLAVIFFPAIHHHYHGTVPHYFLLPIVVGIASISFYTSYLRHKNKGPIFLGTLGIVTLGAALVFSDHHQLWPVVFSVVGSAFILVSHAWNMRACHCFCDTSCSDHDHDH